MASKLSSVLIGFGCLLMLLGLTLLPASLSQRQDESILGAGVCAFAFGSLLTAGGLYLKARALQSSIATESKTQTKQQRGGCDLCGTETPAVMCRAHQLHMCPTCLTRHYDARSCVFVPSGRRPATKAAWA
jgi:hypothetical protein